MQKLERFPDWQERLRRYIHSVASAPFRPCLHDCAKFGAGAVLAQTGVDLADGWGKYRSLEEGGKLLRQHGYRDHIALVEDLLPEVSPLFARAGDIAVLDNEQALSIGVVQGHSIYVTTMRGLNLVPLVQAKRAFRV